MSVEEIFKKHGLKMDTKPKYSLYTYDQIINEVEQTSKDASEIIGFSPENCKIFLYHFKWNSMKLAEKFYDASTPKDFIKKNGIKYILDDTLNEDTVIVGECKVCKVIKDVAILSCSHLFCFDCWKSHARTAKEKLQDSDVLPYLTCDFEGCKAPIPETFTLQLFRDPETYHFYQHMIIQSFIQSNPFYKWCPNKANDCNLAVKIDSSKVEEITCECGFTYCFNCDDLPHSRFPCILIKEWKNKSYSREDMYAKSHFLGCVYDFRQESIKLKNEFQELSILEKMNDESMEFSKIAIKFLHNFRQRSLYFYAYCFFLENEQIFTNFQSNLRILLNTATTLLEETFLTTASTLMIKGSQTIVTNPKVLKVMPFSEDKQMEVLEILLKIQTQLEAQLKSFYEDDWKFKNKEIEQAMLECKY
uniref:RBR-type E3 ubiquitin transferase n=1 Tax=Panagrolaimus davidi TaxID=227884 RepID=A0A914PAY7_9BILA